MSLRAALPRSSLLSRRDCSPALQQTQCGASVGRRTHLPWQAVPGRAPSQRHTALALRRKCIENYWLITFTCKPTVTAAKQKEHFGWTRSLKWQWKCKRNKKSGTSRKACLALGFMRSVLSWLRC